jgi:hypothetical protein
MPAREYDLWIADYRIEPWGEERADLRAGTIVQSNIAPYSKKDIKLKDCILNFEPPKKFDWQAVSKALRSRTIAMGGKVG